LDGLDERVDVALLPGERVGRRRVAVPEVQLGAGGELRPQAADVREPGLPVPVGEEGVHLLVSGVAREGDQPVVAHQPDAVVR
jgi:hypothetical protein